MALNLFRFLTLLACLFLVGCGPSGGTVGDTNDPAETGSDEEQMGDETGEV